jgi:hypothetical protein
MDESVESSIQEFLQRWQHADGSERANYPRERGTD